MEGDVIVLQDVFVFEQTGVVEGKIQGRCARRASALASARSSRSWASTCQQECSGASRWASRQSPSAWPLACCSSSWACRAATMPAPASAATWPRIARHTHRGARRPGRAHQHVRRADQHQPHRGPGLGRQHGARARPRRPRSEAQRVPGHSCRGDRRHSVGHDRAEPVHRPARQPAAVAGWPGRRLVAAPLLAQPAQGQAAQGVQLEPGRHHRADRQRAARRSSFLQAIEMVVRETQPPISTEFGRVIREVNFGLRSTGR